MNEYHFSRPAPALLLAGLLLVACQPGGGEAPPPPLYGASIGGSFALTGEDGQVVRDSDFAGQYRIVYFGYTFCPDVCPIDMQRLGEAMRLLEVQDPELAMNIAPIFISVDPGRDTPEVLTQFTDNFHPRMIGMTGPQETIDQVTESYGVYYALGDDDGSGNYLVDHSNNAILFDRDGAPLAILPLDGDAEQSVAEIRRWAR
jgi:protein SCO1/2